MRALIFISILMAGLTAQAKIECKATVTEFLADGSKRYEEKALTTDLENDVNIILSADLDGRSFVLSGNKPDNTYFLSITWGEGYRQGTLATAAFSPAGRMQVSMVDNSLIYKVECFNNR
ncbi:hypothetical protein D3C87_701440 [compost metagenome]